MLEVRHLFTRSSFRLIQELFHKMYKGFSGSKAFYFMMSEVDVGSIAVEVEPSPQIFCYMLLHVVAAQRQSEKMVSDKEVQTKQRCIIEFLSAD